MSRPEDSRLVPGYDRQATTWVEEMEFHRTALREILGSAENVLLKALAAKLDDPEALKAMSVAELEKVAKLIDTVGKRHDAIGDTLGGPVTPAPGTVNNNQVNVFGAIDSDTIAKGADALGSVTQLFGMFKDRKAQELEDQLDTRGAG